MLKEWLDEKGVEYTEYEHPEVFSVEESKSLKSDIPGMHCKTLFLKDNRGRYYLIGMPANKMLNTKALRGVLGVKKIRFGTPEELKKEVNLTPGSVSIFGAINSKKVVLIIDKEVWNSDKCGFHPNINTSTLVLDHSNLEKYYNSLPNEKMILEL